MNFFFALALTNAGKAHELLAPLLVDPGTPAPDGLGALGFKYEGTWRKGCALGGGFRALEQICQAGNAFKDLDVVPACPDNVDDLNDHYVCIEKDSSTSFQKQYTRTVSNTETFSKLMDSMASVTGTGWGTTMSVASSYVSTTTQLSNGVSFYKTSTGDSFTKKIKYSSHLPLTDVAKNKLKSNVTEFIRTYGSHYVKEIVYSNYFIASVEVIQTSSSSSSGLGIMASINADDLFGAQVAAETSFDMAKNSSSSYLDITASAVYNGPTVYKYNTTSASDVISQVMQAYDMFSDNVNSGKDDYAVPTRVIYGEWGEIQDVDEIFQDTRMPDVLLNGAHVSAALQDLLHQDSMRCQAAKNSIENLLSWDCVKPTSSDLSKALNQVSGDVSGHLDALDHVDDALAAQLEEELAETPADISWFKSLNSVFINEVNYLVFKSDQCTGGRSHFNKEYSLYWNADWRADWHKSFELLPPASGVNSFLTGLGLTIDELGLNLNMITLESATVGFQNITSDEPGIATNKILLWKHYNNQPYHNNKQLSTQCPDGMFITGMTFIFSPVMCACGSPGSKANGYNSRQCTDGSLDYCPHNDGCWGGASSGDGGDGFAPDMKNYDHEFCYQTSPFGVSEGDMRRLKGSSKAGKKSRKGKRGKRSTLNLGNSPVISLNGQIDDIVLRCKPLPKGTYGLPSGEPSTSGPFTIANTANQYAADRVEGQTPKYADCPEGSAVNALRLVAEARARNSDLSQVAIDPRWKVIQETQLFCRKFSDFKA